MEYKRLYIAYGSNINLEQMAHRCPNSKIVSKEMLKGYELEFRGVATIVPNDKSEVPILIWEIDGRDEHSLDRYEGFPNLYRKELFEIEVDGEKKECMAYLMNKGQISPPTSYYYNVINQGYEANGMDTSYLRAALERSVCEQYFDVRITPDKYIPRVDKKGDKILCEGFLIQIFAYKNEQDEIDNFTAAVGFEILEDSLAEAEQLAKDFIDCEGKFIDLKS